jgi:peptidoglycan DL-endopeptidase CwlO
MSSITRRKSVSFEELESPASGDRFETHQTPHLSRRQLREAERARTEAVPVDPFFEIAKVDAAPQRVEPAETSPANNPEVSALFGMQPSNVVRESRDAMTPAEVVGSRSRNSKKSGRTPSKSFAKLARAKGNETAPRKLRRAEVRLVRKADAPKAARKNPLSVLVTMVAVGGMFALAGLPAYAQLDQQQVGTEAAKTDAAAQDLVVPATVAALSTQRDGYTATSPDALAEMSRDALRAAANEAYLASGAREAGDDYPWPYELTDDMGGGLSPLNYYYRECVDFVAWRLNRDQGYYAAPFKWVWSNLTPTGGNGGQWMYAWQQHGWPVSNTPIPGAVAYTGGNHVAYVKSVNADGTVTLEEYNYVPGAYSQRTIPASSVVAFLYPPS